MKSFKQSQKSQLQQQLNNLFLEYSKLQTDEYKKKISMLSSIKRQIQSRQHIQHHEVLEVYEFTIDCLADRTDKEQEFLLHVLALMWKFWTPTEHMHSIYEGILALVQQKSQVTIRCVSYFRAVVETMQLPLEGLTSLSDKLQLQQEKHQRYFAHHILNLFIQFANIFLNKAVVRCEMYSHISDEEESHQTELDRYSSSHPNIKSSQRHSFDADSLYTIKESQKFVLELLLLIHSCIGFDFHHTREEEGEGRGQILLPTKYTKFSQFKEFQLFLSGENTLEMLGYLFLVSSNNELKVQILSLLGDLTRIHLRYFRNKSTHLAHLQAICHFCINSMPGLPRTLNAPKILLLRQFSQLLRKLFKQSLALSMDPQFLKSIFEGLGELLCELFSTPALVEFDDYLSLIEGYMGGLVEISQQIRFHADNQNLLQVVNWVYGRIGKAYENFLYTPGLLFTEDYKFTLTENPCFQTRQSFCHLLKFYRTFTGQPSQNWGDDRLLLWLLSQFQHSFYLLNTNYAGGSQLYHLTLCQLNSQTQNISHILQTILSLFTEENNTEALTHVVYYVLDCIVYEMRIQMRDFFVRVDWELCRWVEWVVKGQVWEVMGLLVEVFAKAGKGEFPPWNFTINTSLLQLTLNTVMGHYKATNIHALTDIMFWLLIWNDYIPIALKTIMFGDELLCNKNNNKWLVFTRILTKIKQYGVGVCADLYQTIRNQFLQLTCLHDPTISNLNCSKDGVMGGLDLLLGLEACSSSDDKYIVYSKMQPLLATIHFQQHPLCFSILSKLLSFLQPHAKLYQHLLPTNITTLLHLTASLLATPTLHDCTLPTLEHYTQLLEEYISFGNPDTRVLLQVTWNIRSLSSNHNIIPTEEKEKLIGRLLQVIIWWTNKYHKGQQAEQHIMNMMQYVKQRTNGISQWELEVVIKHYEMSLANIYMHYPQSLKGLAGQLKEEIVFVGEKRLYSLY